MSTDNNTGNKENKHLTNKLKAHRVLTTANAFSSLAENMQNAIYDDAQLNVNGDDLDKINEDLIKLQDRLIKVVYA